MVKFKLKVSRYGQLYVPKQLREELGRELEALADTRTTVIFKKGLSAKEVLASLRVIMLDLENRAELEEGVSWRGQN